jgi:hypothetical protein
MGFEKAIGLGGWKTGLGNNVMYYVLCTHFYF